MESFSPAARISALDAMATGDLDVLVVGGGITGAGVAREAALRGLRAGLVEARDFASGTSSRSSKLIHGGVRYLQQGDVSLVLEAAEERRILRRIAPHLTRPRPMLFPCFGRGTYSKLNVGLWTYEKLVSIPPEERHEMLDVEATLDREPGLRESGLTGAALYPENLTDDARLVLATLRAAARAGALVANRAAVVRLEARGRGFAVQVRDEEAGRDLSLRSRAVVNAAGPWADAVRKLESGDARRSLHLTKGIHFVVRREDLPVRHMIVMTAADRRPVFLVPRDEVVYVGTTDTDYGQAAEYPEITWADVDYLLQAVRRIFPGATWGRDRVVAAWAGLRPLLHEEGKKPSEISRKDEIVSGPEGMISVAGGKLTTYRHMAEKVVDEVDRRLERSGTASDRSRLEPLEGAVTGTPPEELEAELSALDPALAERLVFFYGDAAAGLARTATDPDGFLPGGRVLRAEVRHAIEEEMALRLTDLLERRLRLLLFDPDQGLELAEEAATEMAAQLGWSRERRDRELSEYRRTAAACRPQEDSA